MLKGIKIKILIVVGIVLTTLLGVYFGLTIFFMDHFYFNTYINEIEVSGLGMVQAQKLLLKEAKDYQITIEERDKKEEVITGEQIDFTYDIEDKVKAIKEKQPSLAWLFNSFAMKKEEVPLEPTFDEEKLKTCFNELNCLSSSNSIMPEDAKVVFSGNKYNIVEGKEGSFVNKEKLYSALKEGIEKKEETLNIEKIKCYKEANIKADSRELIEKRDQLNRYVEMKITYQFGDREEVLDGMTIRNWLKEEAQDQVILDKEKVKAYVEELAKKYDTFQKTRPFKTSTNHVINVSGGDYGWEIDQEEETKELTHLLNEGTKEITREPLYLHKAKHREVDDVGKTYVEVNLTKQYLWLYKEGKLVTEGSIVSGTGSNSHATPEGTYRIDYKKAPAILKGPGYACPVSFWLPFNNGIGIHDATWRSRFGGDIYVHNGSHGCINAPYDMAKTVFENVVAGTPVICYKEK